MKVSCVIVTAGGRPAELARAIASARAQGSVDLEIVVVANGARVEVPEGIRLVDLPANIGPPGARNHGVDEATGELVLFLDDDATFADPGVAAGAVTLFADDPSLGIVSFRIVDPDGRPPQRRHVPRLRAGDPGRSSEVTTFLEGACAIRRSLFVQVGGYPELFWFGHEGTDLAWRALDAGARILYAGDLAVTHPAVAPSRHADHAYLTARNRVFVARRRLPWPLAAVYLALWLALGLARARGGRVMRETLRGYADGMRSPCGERRPIRWRTVVRMTRLGRPPVI